MLYLNGYFYTVGLLQGCYYIPHSAQNKCKNIKKTQENCTNNSMHIKCSLKISVPTPKGHKSSGHKSFKFTLHHPLQYKNNIKVQNVQKSAT